jgi:hypothetical protein
VTAQHHQLHVPAAATRTAWHNMGHSTAGSGQRELTLSHALTP